jgi:hypothetical protein
LHQILEGIGVTFIDEAGTLPGTKLFEPDAQNAKYIFTAVMGNSDVLVGGRHPHTSASEAIMRMRFIDRKRRREKTVDKQVPNSVREQGKQTA